MIKWNEYTWYSRLAAAIFFLGVFPAWIFYLGIQYELAKEASYPIENSHYPEVKQKIIVSTVFPEYKGKLPPTFQLSLENKYSSPDKKFVAVQELEGDPEEGSVYTHIEDMKGNKVTQSFPGSYINWSPDNKTVVVFQSESSTGHRQIFYLGVDGKYQDSNLPYGTYFAAISPDGENIAYTKSVDEGGDAGDIFIRDLEGKDRLLVKGDNNIFVGLQWSADGKSLTFFKEGLGLESQGSYTINIDGSDLRPDYLQ